MLLSKAEESNSPMLFCLQLSVTENRFYLKWSSPGIAGQGPGSTNGKYRSLN